MGELQKRIKSLSKTYPFFEEALESWVEEMRKEFPFDYIDKSESLEYAELHLTINDPRVRKWFEKWFGNSEQK